MNKDTYLCKKCGNINYIESESFDIIYDKYKCICNNIIKVIDHYPNLQATDLIFSVEEIYINIKKQDKKNKKNLTFLLDKNNINLSDNEINSIIKLYEENKSNYLDNSYESYIPSFDNLEDKLLKLGYNTNEIDVIISALPLTIRNKMRKPFIVMTSSVIEMLFNDYFNDFINHKFEEEGSKIIKKQFNKDSISKCITIINGFLNGKFFEKANNISPNFINCWNKLREYRNQILHNNEIYITELTINEMYKLLEESKKVFLHLKSELYENLR